MKNVIAGLEEGLGAIATALEGDGYPKPTNIQQGKVLTADGDDGASWEDAPSGVPSTEYASQGDVLTVDANGDPAWETPSGGGGVPSVTSYDNGKVLTAVYDDKSGTGSASWRTPSSSVGHSTINIADLSYNDKTGNYFASISIPIDKNIIGCNAVAVSSAGTPRTQCPVSNFTIENDQSTIWEIINISSTVYGEISQDYTYIDIIYA